ncbi:unnamed protein product [Closterium sp. Naga37s-1]|nr:unnamed protein product [Closterium sp. Naga37s-1]
MESSPSRHLPRAIRGARLLSARCALRFPRPPPLNVASSAGLRERGEPQEAEGGCKRAMAAGRGSVLFQPPSIDHLAKLPRQMGWDAGMGARGNGRKGEWAQGGMGARGNGHEGRWVEGGMDSGVGMGEIGVGDSRAVLAAQAALAGAAAMSAHGEKQGGLEDAIVLPRLLPSVAGSSSQPGTRRYGYTPFLC